MPNQTKGTRVAVLTLGAEKAKALKGKPDA